MKQTFVNNIQQLMTANQNQRIKISYLESQKQKRQEYMQGLKQSIKLNKQTLIVLNQQGANNQALDCASRQNMKLISINNKLYNENRQLNAMLLMEQQLRIQEKAFYLQRIVEFQNRISDLRKYLHDKEQSFSTVIARLKKYQEFNQKHASETIQNTQSYRKVTQDIVSKLLIEKNMFKAKFYQVFPDANRYQLMKKTFKNPVNLNRLNKNIQDMQQDQSVISERNSPRIHIDNQLKINNMIDNKQIKKKNVSNNITNIKASQVNKQILRICKKQKLNNQILQKALQEAIQKNEQLIKINGNLDISLTNLQKKMQKIIAQNNFYKLQLKKFSSGSYGNKYSINRIKDDFDQPSFLNLLRISFQINNNEDEQVSHKIYKDLLKQSLKQDIQKLMKIPIRQYKHKKQEQNQVQCISEQQQMNDMTTNDMTNLKEKHKYNHKYHNNKQEQNNYYQYKKVMVKSASQPRLFFQWVDQVEQFQNQDELVIQQF